VEINLSTVSVVIPTVRDQVLTLKSLEGLPVEVVIERTKNVSKARNIGVTRCHGEIVVVMDDDLAFPREWFEYYVRRVRLGFAFWNDPPFILFVTKDDYLRAGGFDENITMDGECYELFLAIESVGVVMAKLNMKPVVHLIKSTTDPLRNTFKEDWQGWKHATLSWTRYKPKRKWWKVILWIKDPRTLFKIFFLVIWWSLKGGQERKGLQQNQKDTQ